MTNERTIRNMGDCDTIGCHQPATALLERPGETGQYLCEYHQEEVFAAWGAKPLLDIDALAEGGTDSFGLIRAMELNEAREHAGEKAGEDAAEAAALAAEGRKAPIEVRLVSLLSELHDAWHAGDGDGHCAQCGAEMAPGGAQPICADCFQIGRYSGPPLTEDELAEGERRALRHVR